LPIISGTHRLAAFSPSGGYAQVEIEIPSAAAFPAELVITMPETLDARGRVVAAGGSAVENVVVRVRSVSSWPAMPEGEPAMQRAGFHTRTDARGCYLLSGLPRGETMWIAAEAPGRVTGHLRLDGVDGMRSAAADACDDLPEIVLPPARSISGTVRDQDGQPIEGATIIEQRQQDAVGGHYYRGPSATTDTAGRFRIDGLAAGDYSLTVRAAGHVTVTQSNVQLGPTDLPLPDPAPREQTDGTAPVAAAMAVTVDLMLERIDELETLEVVVFDPRGAPEAEADVRVSRSGPAPLPRNDSGVTGADGRVVLRAVPAGLYHVVANAHGAGNNSSWRGPFEVRGDGAIAVIEMSPARVPSVSLSGRFVDEAGRGVGLALIRIRSPSFFEAKTITEADGSFLFERVPAGRYLLEAAARGLPAILHRALLEASPPGIEGLEVRVPSLGTIHGSVGGLRDGDRGEISLQAETEERHDDRFGLTASAPGTVAADGTFRIERLIPGTWRVTASAPGGRQAIAEVTVGESGSSPPVRLELPAGYTLTGTVRWRGAPPAEAVVEVRQIGGGGQRTVSFDPQGSFAVPGLPPGEYRVGIGNTGLQRVPFVLIDVREDTDVDLVVRGASLGGQIFDADGGIPLAGAHVSIERLGDFIWTSGDQLGMSTDRNGAFAVGPLPAGSWRFEFRAPGYGQRAQIVELGDQDIDDYRIELRQTPGLHLRFETPDGSLPEIISLAWFSLEDGIGFQHSAFPDGVQSMEFHWPEIGLGDGVLYAHFDEQRLAARLVLTNEGDPIVVPLRGGGRLQVAVPDLQEGEQAVMRLADEGGLSVTDSIGSLEWRRWADGGFRTRTLPAGRYRITVTANDGRVWSGSADIVAFESTEIVLR
jgi:hypothetical protein